MNTATTTQQPTISLNPVESAQIHAIGHDPETNTLAICFRRGSGPARGPGSVYHYGNFTADEFEAFKNADSLGKHFGSYIKPFPLKYPYKRINEQQLAA